MQKITIEPVTRIEGHAKVTIHLNGKGKVEKAYMHVNEWRGFEKFTEGRPFFEMPQITPRICGICPVSHHLGQSLRPRGWRHPSPAGTAPPGIDAYGPVHPVPFHALLRIGRTGPSLGF
jgi:hypothetical protein